MNPFSVLSAASLNVALFASGFGFLWAFLYEESRLREANKGPGLWAPASFGACGSLFTFVVAFLIASLPWDPKFGFSAIIFAGHWDFYTRLKPLALLSALIGVIVAGAYKTRRWIHSVTESGERPPPAGTPEKRLPSAAAPPKRARISVARAKAVPPVSPAAKAKPPHVSKHAKSNPSATSPEAIVPRRHD